MPRSPLGGGCTFAEDPARSCAEVTPVWSADVDSRVLRVRCRPCGGEEPRALDIRGYRCAVAVEGSVEHVALALGGEPLRLDVVEGSLLGGPVLVEAAIGLEREVTPQVFTVQRLDRLLRGLDAGSSPGRRLTRLVLALRALDAKAGGASLRDISRGVLGAEEWPGDGECAKSSARRIVALAAALCSAHPAEIVSGRI